jgi:hypothetical protein
MLRAGHCLGAHDGADHRAAPARVREGREDTDPEPRNDREDEAAMGASGPSVEALDGCREVVQGPS